MMARRGTKRRRLGWLGWLAILVALAAAGVIAAARIPLALFGQSAVADARRGGPGAGDALADAERITDIVGGVWLAGYIVAAVLFLRWLHRAMRNLQAPGLPRPRY